MKHWLKEKAKDNSYGYFDEHVLLGGVYRRGKFWDEAWVAFNQDDVIGEYEDLASAKKAVERNVLMLTKRNIGNVV